MTHFPSSERSSKTTSSPKPMSEPSSITASPGQMPAATCESAGQSGSQGPIGWGAMWAWQSRRGRDCCRSGTDYSRAAPCIMIHTQFIMHVPVPIMRSRQPWHYEPTYAQRAAGRTAGRRAACAPAHTNAPAQQAPTPPASHQPAPPPLPLRQRAPRYLTSGNLGGSSAPGHAGREVRLDAGRAHGRCRRASHGHAAGGAALLARPRRVLSHACALGLALAGERHAREGADGLRRRAAAQLLADDDVWGRGGTGRRWQGIDVGQARAGHGRGAGRTAFAGRGLADRTWARAHAPGHFAAAAGALTVCPAARRAGRKRLGPRRSGPGRSGPRWMDVFISAAKSSRAQQPLQHPLLPPPATT